VKDKGMNTQSALRIQKLIDTMKYKSYMEIGVASGSTWKKIVSDTKIAIDPRFAFDWKGSALTGEYLYEMTSDEYFRILPRSIEVDIAFIDGLHTFDQVLKDILNVISILSPNGVILLDDTVPIDEFSAMTDQFTAVASRKAVMGSSAHISWHGDVYKSLFFINDFMMRWDFATIINDGNPQTLLWRSNGETKRKSICGSLEHIESMSFEQWGKIKNVLPELSESDAFQKFFEAQK